jgi:hypothetical protein
MSVHHVFENQELNNSVPLDILWPFREGFYVFSTWRYIFCENNLKNVNINGLSDQRKEIRYADFVI